MLAARASQHFAVLPAAKSSRQHIKSRRTPKYKAAPVLILQLLWQQFSKDAAVVNISVCLLSIKWLCSVVSCCYVSLCHQGQLKQEQISEMLMLNCLKVLKAFNFNPLKSHHIGHYCLSLDKISSKEIICRC